MSLSQKAFKNGEEIIKEGDIGKSFYLLTEGKAGVYANYEKNNPFRIAVLEPGEYFGEMAILEAYPRNATVVAVGNVNVIEIPADEMSTFFEENPEQVFELMKHIGKRIQLMTDDYNESEALLKEARGTTANTQSESFFSKIKKHINMYQSNKNPVNEPNEEALRAELIELFGTLSDKTEAFEKDTIVYSEGDTEDCMFVLQRGTVGMYTNCGEANEAKTSELNAISFFGEVEMATGEPRSVTAVSETDDTRIEVIYPEDLAEMVQTNPAKVNLILRYLSYRLRRLNIDFLKNCKEITESYNK
ncbi:MAG: cyclic nucleotide-binding domain-containing protein [Clostridiales bacterium]|nr:cyclic nucleotide-binding domain-containing protein [Clostridiales bacterium]